MRLFTLCSYLITKESYDWWITRRKWGFKHRIFKEKNLKVSVTNIWKHSGRFRRHARWLRISQAEGLHFAAKGWFRSHHLVISQPKADFATVKLAFRLVWLASNGYNFFISTPNRAPFEALNSNFLGFETTYSMHEMDSRKCSKSVQQLMSSWILHVRFLSLFSLLAFMICLWQRTIKLQSLCSSC